jgi:hypothetical protein
MNKIKSILLQILSGVEIAIRSFQNQEPVGESIDLSMPAQPRVMRTCSPKEPRDFNSWAQHVHRELQKKYK